MCQFHWHTLSSGSLKKHLAASSEDLSAVKLFKEKVTLEIMCHFTTNSLEIVSKAPPIELLLLVATISFRSLSERQCSLVHQALRIKVEVIHSQEESQKTAESEERELATKKRKSAMSFLL